MANSTEEHLNALLATAYMLGASDIHLEPSVGTGIVKARVDGRVQRIKQIPADQFAHIVGRVKLLSRMDISEKRLPQDGSFQWDAPDSVCDIRVSAVPVLHGEKVVMRLHTAREDLLTVEQIGLDPHQYPVLLRLLAQRNGFVLIAGAVGSGKTTTLYAAVRYLAAAGRNVFSVEDPIEAHIEGISQMQVHPGIGLRFAEGIRSALRQDPDVLVIGEVRDKETAELSMLAALTGHLVLSTMHAGDSVQALQRFAAMGVPSESLATAIRGVVHQRLVRKLCVHCKKETSRDRRPVSYWKDAVPPAAGGYDPVGCARCGFSGFLGRVPVFETIDFSKEEQRQPLLAHRPWEWPTLVRNGKERGMDRTIWKLAKEGVVEFGEYLEWVQGPQEETVMDG